MAKECPSCHVSCNIIRQCQNSDCRRVFCDVCNFPIIVSTSCPKCGSYSEIISRDDDCEETSSSDYEETPDESTYSSSGYSSTSSNESSKSSSDIFFWVIVFAIGLPIGAFFNDKNQDRQNTSISSAVPLVPSKSQPSTPRQLAPEKKKSKTQPNGLVGTETPAQANINSGLNQYRDCGWTPSWVFVEFCHNPKLAALNQRVIRLETIKGMADDEGGVYSFEARRWQREVTEECEDNQSPKECLRSHLEERSQWLQETIVQALNSPKPALFKDYARERWKNHNW